MIDPRRCWNHLKAIAALLRQYIMMRNTWSDPADSKRCSSEANASSIQFFVTETVSYFKWSKEVALKSLNYLKVWWHIYLRDLRVHDIKELGISVPLMSWSAWHLQQICHRLFVFILLHSLMMCWTQTCLMLLGYSYTSRPSKVWFSKTLARSK